MKKHIVWLFVFMIVAVGLAACGGGGGGGGAAAGGDPGTGTGATNTLTGVVSKGLISGATVTVYALDASGATGAVLGSSITESDGSYVINLGSYTGTVIVKASGGTYKDEATGSTVTNGVLLRSVATSVTGTAEAAVTPLTEIAVQKAGTLTASNVAEAVTLVSNMIGGANIVTTMPANVLVSSASTTAEKNYGLALAAISQMVKDGTASSVSDAVAKIASDLADSKLDTTGGSVSSALSTFITSTANQTGLTEASAPAVQTVTAATTNTVMGKWSLNGTFAHVSQTSGFYSYGTNPILSASMESTSAGTATFDGNGGCSLTVTETGYDMMHTTNNLSPSPTNSTFTVTCTYTVGADGALAVTVGTDGFTGWVSIDGATILAGGPYAKGTVKASDQLLMVKTGTSMSNASLTGTFRHVGQTAGFYTYGTNPVLTASMVSSSSGTATFNGNGGCSLTVTDTGYDMIHTTDTVSSSPSNSTYTVACTYTVSGSGALSIMVGTDGFTGTLSADGMTILVGGPFANGTVKASDQAVMVKVGTGKSLASLNGTYRHVGQTLGFFTYGTNPVLAAGMESSSDGTLSFDGNGGCSLITTDTGYDMMHTTNVISASPSNSRNLYACTYIVTLDGTFTVTVGVDTFSGWLSSDDNTILCGGPYVNGSVRASDQVVMVKVPI